MDTHVQVLRMLAAAGNPQSVLAQVAGLTAKQRTAVFKQPHQWGVHRRRWELYQCLAMLRRTDDPDGCWLTTGYRASSGHATCSRKSLATTSLHRQVYMITSGRYDLSGLVVRHTCLGGGPNGCARPEHLTTGTRSCNNRDRARHRRGQRILGREADELLHMDVLDVPPDELRLLADLEWYLARLRPVGDSCLTVDGSRRDHYRTVTLAGRRGKLHRHVLELARGRPLELYALHACDRPQCCAVAHLTESTLSVNTRDAYERGRLGTGEQHPRAVLRNGAATLVQRRADDGWDNRRLADDLGVPIAVVRQAARRQTYNRTGEPARPAKLYLSDRGVRSCRAQAAMGVPLDVLATRTGLGHRYLHDLLRHRHRPDAGGPRLAPAGPARGSAVGTARLDRLGIAVARQRVNQGETCAAIAGDLGVAPTSVERAVRGITWAS